MDGREGMSLPGSGPYYLYRGMNVAGASGSSGANTVAHGAFNSPPGFRNLPNPNPNPNPHQVQSNFRGAVSSGGPSTFNVDGSPGSFPPHGFTMTVASASEGGGGEPGASPSQTEPMKKKKRGRPRKYGPDGSGAGGGAGGSGGGGGGGAVSLGLSPLSGPDENTPSERAKRGRPPGSGRKQRLASVGEWMSSSAGHAFTPHVIFVAPGEDVALKILSFAQQRPRALCIMSGSGGISAVTLRQPASSVGNVTHEGRFEILCLSGSYLVADTGGARNRTGGVNVSLSNHDGRVIGGSVAGRLVASRPVQVVVCSFAYENPKVATPALEPNGNGENNTENHTGGDNRTVRPSNPPAAASQQQHMNPNTDIDLMRG